MKKYTDVILDTAGNALNAATVTVVAYPGGGAVTIYSDDGTTVVASSIVTTNSLGEFSFYAPPGRYNLQVRVSGALVNTITDVQFDEGVSEEVATVAAMKALKGMTDGQICYVTSYYASATPDGGGSFKYDSTSSATANDGTIIAPDAGGVGRWLRVYSGAVHLLWFGVKDDATDQTTRIQAALDVGRAVYVQGSKAGRKYYFTNITQRLRQQLYGDGQRASVLRQMSSATGVAITVESGTPPSGGPVNDITEGAVAWSNLGLEVKGSTGIKAGPGTLAAFMLSENFRIQHQHSESLGAAPYTVVAGTRAFDLDNASGGAVYFSSHKNLEVRSFETAVYARSAVNEQNWHGWFLDCLIGFDLNGQSTWNTRVSFESGVENARAFKLAGTVSNLLADGGRVEFTQAGGYMFEFVAGLTATNVRVRNPNIIISGDGAGWPARKYTGTAPADFLFSITDSDGHPFTIAPLVASAKQVWGGKHKFGGSGRGNGQLEFGRNADNGAVSRIEHDGTHFYIVAGNSLRLSGDGTTNFKVDVTNTGVGFQGTAGIAKPAISGSRTNDAALSGLLSALVSYGLVSDSTTTITDGSATYDPASLADGVGATTTVTVTGAALGDFAEASFSLDLQGITVTAWVSAADTVSVRFQNETAGTIDLASGTLRARVRKA